jgi:putative flippase GtrA
MTASLSDAATSEADRLVGPGLIGRARAGLGDVLPQIGRYGIVSVMALGADFALFLVLAQAGLRPSLAGAAGYAFGLILHFLLSVRFVFDADRSAKSQPRLFGEFAVSGAVGMCITAGTIAVATDAFHLAPVIGKVLAVGVSFLVVFALRRAIVFAPRTGSAGA